jgi:serine phosphatase RsbU (regulator of sigma subunit)
MVAAFVITLLPAVLLQTSTIRRWETAQQGLILQAQADSAIAAAEAVLAYISELRRDALALHIDFPNGRPIVSSQGLADLRRSYGPALFGMAVADRQGRIVATTLRGASEASARRYEEFRRVAAGEDWAVSDVAAMPGVPRSAVALFCARRGQDRLLRAVVIFWLDPSALGEELQARLSGGSHLIIADRRGVLVFSSLAPQLPDVARPSWRDHPLIKAAVGGRPSRLTSFTSPFDGIQYMGSSVLVRPINWVAASTSQVAVAMQPINKELARSTLWLLLTVAIILTVAWIVTTGLTQPIQALATAARRVAGGDLTARARVTSRDEVEAFATVFNDMVARLEDQVGALEDSRAKTEQLLKELQAAYKRERNVAEALQRAMLPKSPPAIPQLAIGHLYRPASEDAFVGGDYYDFVPLAGGGLLVAIGDVCGKGLDAASEMAGIKHALRVCATEDTSPGGILGRINRFLCEQPEFDLFSTMLCVVVRLECGEILWSNAGHEPAAVLRDTGEVDVLESPGFPLGIEPSAAYTDKSTPFGPGDILVMYTDGITDAHKRGNYFLLDGLARTVSQLRGTPPQLMAESVYETAREFAGGRLVDDAAVVVVRGTPAS